MKWLIHPIKLPIESHGTPGILVSKKEIAVKNILIFNLLILANIDGGLRSSEIAVDDLFIRKFMTGTWHNLFVSEIIIKRQYNIIRITGIIRRSINSRKMYFLIGYTEELLSFWLQCPVKLELQTVADKKDVIFKYI